MELVFFFELVFGVWSQCLGAGVWIWCSGSGVPDLVFLLVFLEQVFLSWCFCWCFLSWYPGARASVGVSWAGVSGGGVAG